MRRHGSQTTDGSVCALCGRKETEQAFHRRRNGAAMPQDPRQARYGIQETGAERRIDGPLPEGAQRIAQYAGCRATQPRKPQRISPQEAPSGQAKQRRRGSLLNAWWPGSHPFALLRSVLCRSKRRELPFGVQNQDPKRLEGLMTRITRRDGGAGVDPAPIAASLHGRD